MDNCMDAWMVNDERAAWMDERMDGWSDEYGDDDYDSNSDEDEEEGEGEGEEK